MGLVLAHCSKRSLAGSDHSNVRASSALSCFCPFATMRSDPSGSGRCSALASVQGRPSTCPFPPGVVRITGMASSWIAETSAFAFQVRKEKMSFVVSPSRTFRTDVHRGQIRAKQTSGRLSSSANQTGASPPYVPLSGSAKLLNGTRQRFWTPNHRPQWTS